MEFTNIITKKIILSNFEFKSSKQGGYYSNETEICKYEFNQETKDQQKLFFERILKSLDCKPDSKIINKIIKDISKNEFTVFEQIKPGLKTALLKKYSLKIETTTNKQFQLL
jgi:RNA binding exosome subunit